MWQTAVSFLAGYACHSQCASLPLSARLKTGSDSRPFKLSIVIHSAAVDKISRPGLVQDQRPFVVIRVGDRSKETELGDWSKDKQQWCFKEVLTIEVGLSDEIWVDVSSNTKYDFWVASVQTTSSRLGEANFPVNSVLPRLKPEDRDADGIVWASPIIPIDVREDGNVTGRVYLSFETNQAPPAAPKAGDGSCCQMNSSMQSFDDSGCFSSTHERVDTASAAGAAATGAVPMSGVGAYGVGVVQLGLGAVPATARGFGQASFREPPASSRG